MSGIDPRLLELRNRTYALFVEAGRAPTADELAVALGRTPDDVTAGWRRLHDAHALVLDDAGELLMAHPFSAVQTPFRVQADGRSWYANCAWDAFGICAALHVDGMIETQCPDCGDAIVVDVHGVSAFDDSLLFHCLVPARHWWDDVVYT